MQEWDRSGTDSSNWVLIFLHCRKKSFLVVNQDFTARWVFGNQEANIFEDDVGTIEPMDPLHLLAFWNDTPSESQTLFVFNFVHVCFDVLVEIRVNFHSFMVLFSWCCDLNPH